MKIRNLFACVMCQNIKIGKFSQVLQVLLEKCLLNAMKS
jgi:uncharacterized Fe-S radical SAM superfamily protein PflX